MSSVLNKDVKSNTNWKNPKKRNENIAKSLKERAAAGNLPWQLEAKQRKEDYNNTPKNCKHCGEIYYKAWTKSGKSDFCSSKCAKAYSTAAKRAEINAKVSNALKGISTNKGGKIPVYENYLKYPKICPICGKTIPWEKRTRKTCSDKCGYKSGTQKNQQSGLYKRNGGYREGSGRSKSGYWKGDFCGSTYELVYWIYCKEHNIPIKRNTKRYPYIFEGKEHTYLPDYIVDGKLVEIKGYVNAAALAKAAAVLEGIQILTIKELEPMMEYVDKTYGTHHKGKVNNYHTLYDEYKPKFTYICSHCGKEFTRDKELITELKFCSQSCAGSYGRPCNKDLVDAEYVLENAVPVPGLDGFWFSKNNELYSNRVKRRDGKYLRCSLQGKDSNKSLHFRVGSTRRTIGSLRKLCGFE